MLRIRLGVGQAWAGSRKLRDIAVDELHFEGSEVFRVGHLVGMLNDEVSVGVGLSHHQELLLEYIDRDHIVHGIGECGDWIEAANVILDYRHHREVAQSPSLDEVDERD